MGFCTADYAEIAAKNTFKERSLFVLFTFCFFTSLLGGCSAPPGVPQGEAVLYEHDSVYHHILVSEDAEARYLRFGYGRLQGAMTLADPVALRVAYTAYLAVGLAFGTPRQVLMVGLAGGALPRFVRAFRPGVAVDMVEIDPEVVTVAHRFFGVREGPGYRVHAADGRVFVKRTKRQYDWVVLDAFDADTVPFHLTTVEFLNEVKAILHPGGVVTANVARLGPGILYRSMIRTFEVCFPQVYLFPVPNRGNIVVVATLEARRRPGAEIAASIRALKQETGKALDLLEVTGPLLDENPVVADAPILTDDYAPVDLLRYREGL